MRRLALGLAAMAVMAAGPLPVPPRRPPPPAPVALSPVTVRGGVVAMPDVEGAPVAGALALTSDDPAFGGLSGVAVARDGGAVTLISDRGALYAARIERVAGALSGLTNVRRAPLRDARGRRLTGAGADAEDIAIAPGGGFALSFEGVPPRVLRFASPGGPGRAIRLARDILKLQDNSGLEALSYGPDGALYMIPERSGRADRPFPVWRKRAGRWSLGRWPRRDDYLVTGADIGPDGALYVVERAFTLLGGFRWRLSRARLSDWPEFRPELVAAQRLGGFDNIEGVSVFQTPALGLRAVLIADDNFIGLQRSLLLELGPLDPMAPAPEG